MPSKSNRKLVTTSLVWDMRDFAYSVMIAKPGEFVGCPIFNLKNRNNSWKFYIFPKGISSEDYISFYLHKMYPSNQTVYNCRLSVGRPGATPDKSYEYINVQFLDSDIGEDFFLLKTSNSWVLRGPVRFRCDITEIGPKNHDLIRVSPLNSFFRIGLPDNSNLSLELEELMNVPFHSDLTVDIDGHEIYVHKYILYVRCPNLSYEFGYRTIFEMPSTVEIQVDDEIFELLMYYIYTGKLRDSYIPMELYRFAERLRLLSLIECVYERPYSYHIYTEPDVVKQVISWNLDELNFSEEGSTCVHILRTQLYVERLAIQVSVLDGCENEKFIYISFKFFGLQEYRPIMLVCNISLTSQAGLEVFKEEQHVYLEDEQWNFSRLRCQKDKKNMRLTAELSMFDVSNPRRQTGIETKTKLYTDFQTVTENIDDLRSSMGFLYQMSISTSNLILLSSDNKFFRVHDGIMWARWPGVKKLIDVSSVSSDEEINKVPSQLELNLPSEVLISLIEYFYTGCISNFDRAKAKVLLKYSNHPQYPYHLVKKCEAVLFNHHQNQL